MKTPTGLPWLIPSENYYPIYFSVIICCMFRLSAITHPPEYFLPQVVTVILLANLIGTKTYMIYAFIIDYQILIMSDWIHVGYYFVSLAATKQLYEWFSPSVRPSVSRSVCLSARLSVFLSYLFIMFLSSYNHAIFRSYYQWQKRCPCKKSRSEVKGQGHRGQNPFLPIPDRNSSLNSHMVYGDEMIHTAWCCFKRGALLFSKVICQIAR